MKIRGYLLEGPRSRDASVPRGVRLVATLEATKAFLVLLAGFGLLRLVHHDVSAIAAKLITRLHLNRWIVRNRVGQLSAKVDRQHRGITAQIFRGLVFKEPYQHVGTGCA